MKHVYQYFLLCQNTGYDVFNSVIRWHPASIGYPASIRDPAYTRSFMVSAHDVMTEMSGLSSRGADVIDRQRAVFLTSQL